MDSSLASPAKNKIKACARNWAKGFVFEGEEWRNVVVGFLMNQNIVGTKKKLPEGSNALPFEKTLWNAVFSSNSEWFDIMVMSYNSRVYR